MFNTPNKQSAYIIKIETQKPMQIVREFESVYTSPLDIIKKYMEYHIKTIDNARIEVRRQYPNFLPSL